MRDPQGQEAAVSDYKPISIQRFIIPNLPRNHDRYSVSDATSSNLESAILRCLFRP